VPTSHRSYAAENSKATVLHRDFVSGIFKAGVLVVVT